MYKILKIFFLFIIATSVELVAKVEHLQVSQSNIKNIIIIDIRTKPEWIETGILPDSETVTFFNIKGEYNIPKFLRTLNKITNNGKNKFAIICRTGSRTTMISDFLSRQGYNFINLKGGIMLAKRKGIKLVKYKEK